MRKTFDPFKNTIEEMRVKLDKMSQLAKLPKGTVVEKITIGDIPAEWVRAANVGAGKEKVILYFHSGGFCLGYNNAHRDLAARISAASKCSVLALDYRLAPEHPYPAANQDCLKAYRWLLQNGISPKNIVIGGDSAGAGLTLMTLLALRDVGEPLPVAAFMLSMFGGDLIKFDGESYKTRAKADPLNNLENIRKFADHYFGSAATKPSIPIEQNLSGLPKMLIQVGDNEVILSDSVRLAERAKEAGVDVTLEVWENMWHSFQGFASLVPEARRAISRIGDFVNQNA